jgi:hypothetical protein
MHPRGGERMFCVISLVISGQKGLNLNPQIELGWRKR